MYRWWVFVHLAGVFAFLVAHGVSVGVLFRLRSERDPARVAGLLELSGSSIRAFYASLAVLVAAGVVAGFLGHWWSQGWIWAAVVVLVLTSLAMYGMARPYYRRVAFVARAIAGGSKAVSGTQFDDMLRSRRPVTVAVIGFVGLAGILYLMLFKPTLGFGAVTTPRRSGAVSISARSIAFDTATLRARAGRAFSIVFDNADAGVPHNVAIYQSASGPALFRGAIVTGPRTVTYRVRALPPGRYVFRCDVHPVQMRGTLVVAGARASPLSGSSASADSVGPQRRLPRGDDPVT